MERFSEQAAGPDYINNSNNYLPSQKSRPRSNNKGRDRTPEENRSYYEEKEVKNKLHSFYKKRKMKQNNEYIQQSGEVYESAYNQPSLRSKSSNFARHHNNCRCYICTCQRSNHRCPASRGLGKPFIDQTVNRVDFQNFPSQIYRQALDPYERNLNKPSDNLQFRGDFNDTTIYKKDFKKDPKDSNKQHENFMREQQYNRFVRDMNNEDHISKYKPATQMISKRDHINTKYGDLQVNYTPPKKYRKSVPYKKSRPFTEKTIYQEDFKNKKNRFKSPSAREIKHADNLKSYHPEIGMAKFTEYNFKNYMNLVNKKEHSPYKQNNEIYKLFKERDMIPGNVIPIHMKNIPGVTTEYKKNFNEFKIKREGCDLNVMPKVDPQLMNAKKHIYWNKFKDDWSHNRY